MSILFDCFEPTGKIPSKRLTKGGKGSKLKIP